MSDKQWKLTGKDDVQILTPVFRVSFPAVFQPKVSNLNPGADPKFTITMLFDIKDPEVKKGVIAMQQAVNKLLVGKLGPDQAKWPKGIRLPLRKGEEKDLDGYGAGIVFCSASSKQRPGLVDQSVKPIIDPSEFYGGCYARATLNPFWYDKGVNKGVSFGLRNIQKVRDGEPFSGKSKPENDFDSIAAPAVADLDGTMGGGGGDGAAGDGLGLGL